MAHAAYFQLPMPGGRACNATSLQRAAAFLGRDDRGAILVPALVMGALLTGALFYVAAVGDAIIFRTQLQDAADTTAFTSAVWHAKGMNIVAVINIFMSLLLVVIVLFHVAELLCLLIAIFPPATIPAMNVFRSLTQAETRVSRVVDSGLNILQTAQKGVVVAVPYIAAFNAKRMPTAAESVWPGSMALLPVPVDRILMQERTRMPDLGPAALPVQEDEFGTLCTRAVLFVPEQIAQLISRLPLPGFIQDRVMSEWDGIKGKIEHVTDAGDGIMCQPVNSIIAALAGAVVNAVGNACEHEADELEQERQRQERAANPNAQPRPETAAERDARERRRRSHVDTCSQNLGSDLSRESGISAVPAMVWTAAANGNVFTHVWSRVSGTPRMFGSDQRFMAFAGQGRAPAVTPSGVAVAEAEFYCDCEGEWSSCQADALWAPNWTARMRRFRWPQEELRTVVQQTALNLGSVLQDVAFDQAQEFVSGLFGRNNEFVGDVIANFLFEKLQEIELFDQLAQKANAAIAEGIEAAGLSDLFNPRDEDEQRIH